MKSLNGLALAVAALLITGCGGGGVGSTGAGAGASVAQLTGGEFASADASAAAAYCKQTKGEVFVRYPLYGTNGSSPLRLAGERSFCQYTSKKDGSRIHILLSTLYTTKPSLAALAYILAPPTGSCQGNPASCYCTLLGGSDQFGGTAGNGGGWYNKNSEDQTLEACIFPDMSSIDSWGLAYHANGIVRGIDLTKVMRYKYPGSKG
ncbi:MAG TPA: hypothetical protein VMU38_11920 [Candidatus Binatia bacterium]|nr:hypothetical protein [Candidatus Binatia bacterium]